MPQFSLKSLDKLATVHPDLARLFLMVIEEEDCVILCGHRGEAEQNQAHDLGHSHTRWPHGRHNSMPAEAVDVAPYPVDWEDIPRFQRFGERVKEIAKRANLAVEWGGDWASFRDYPHWQLPKVMKAA